MTALVESLVTGGVQGSVGESRNLQGSKHDFDPNLKLMVLHPGTAVRTEVWATCRLQIPSLAYIGSIANLLLTRTNTCSLVRTLR